MSFVEGIIYSLWFYYVCAWYTVKTDLGQFDNVASQDYLKDAPDVRLSYLNSLTSEQLQAVRDACKRFLSSWQLVGKRKRVPSEFDQGGPFVVAYGCIYLIPQLI